MFTLKVVNTASGFQCRSNPSSYWQMTLGCFTPFTTAEFIPATATQQGVLTSEVLTVAVGTADAVNAYAIAIQISALSTKANLPKVLSQQHNIDTVMQVIPNTGSPMSLAVVTTNPTISATTSTSSSRPLSGSSETQPSSLSATAKAAIGVGVLGILLILFLVGFCWCKKRRRAPPAVQSLIQSNNNGILESSPDSASTPNYYLKAPFWMSNEIHELEGHDGVATIRDDSQE
jgi:hypothetical protein